jgi:hypothetical protein
MPVFGDIVTVHNYMIFSNDPRIFEGLTRRTFHKDSNNFPGFHPILST